VLGLVIAVVVLAASAHENTAGTALLDQVAAGTPTVTTALVDQGFKSSVVARGAGLGTGVQVVERNPADKGFVPQPKRRVVEQRFGILSFHRRLVRGYEHRAASSASRVYWAMTGVTARRVTGPLGPVVAGHVTAPDPGRHLLDRIGAREQALARQAEQAQAAIGEAATRLRELWQEISDLQVTRKTLIALAGQDDLPPAAEPAPPPDLPEHPAYRQIMDTFADQQRPPRTRDRCTAPDLPVAAKHIEGIRSKLKRLASRGILTETEPGLFTQPRP
jgi:hypothetical protein